MLTVSGGTDALKFFPTHREANASKGETLLFKVIHLRTGIKLMIGTYEECLIMCDSLREGEYIILPQ